MNDSKIGKAIMKVLITFAGLGGTNLLWPKDLDITAIEINPEIARIYKDKNPTHNVIVTDAYAYLQEHFHKFDFIWASPPCPTHSRFRKQVNVPRGQSKPVYPDLRLYEVILFLKHYYTGPWCVENVVSYYDPLIEPVKISKHYLWANFEIPIKDFPRNGCISGVGNTEKVKSENAGISLEGYKLSPALTKRKDQLLNNFMNSDLGRYIFDCAFPKKEPGPLTSEQVTMRIYD